MPDMKFDFAPWLPATQVGLYEKRSELMLSDSPPPETTLVQTQVVQADQSLTFTALVPGDYWAIAPIDGVFRYVQLVVREADELSVRMTAAEQAIVNNAADITALDARLDIAEPKIATNAINITNLDAGLTGAINRIAALETKIDQHNATFLDGAQGIIAPSSAGWDYVNVGSVVNRMHFSRFVPPRAMTARSIALIVEAWVSDGNTDVGIYDANGVRLVSTGLQAGKLPSAGRKVIAINPTALLAGVPYYAALTTTAVGSWGGADIGGTYGVGVLEGLALNTMLIQNTAGALPANWTAPATAAAAGVVLAVMET